ncbi:hypothetical protein GCM10010485_28860 [Streptosporangium carneum]
MIPGRDTPGPSSSDETESSDLSDRAAPPQYPSNRGEPSQGSASGIPSPPATPLGETTPPRQTTSDETTPSETTPGETTPGEATPARPETGSGDLGGKADGRPAQARRLRAVCQPVNVICAENNLPGNPPSEWDVSGGGSSNIQGYAAQMSVNKGSTVQFKVNTNSPNYRLDIYRIGYYNGMGARLITTISPSASLPQTQPACLSNATTGLVDCGNWGVSASWAVPNTVVSGVYLAKLVRQDATSGSSHIVFVVRDDSRDSDILLQTSDATWQAYNTYGGNSLYVGSPAGRAFKVSYNRPFGAQTRRFFESEYPMIRWVEANGYDVGYTSSIDTASRGAEMLDHKMFMVSGHDEYWSREMRENAENARNNGVSLAFFSGNEVFWKTRWENSIDSSNTPFRTLVCYKETTANAKIDPSPEWTGTWRDPRFVPPEPENGLTGTLFRINGYAYDAITVPSEFAAMRLWRNTSVANLQPGQTATFPGGTLGYEWDEAPDNGFQPAGLVKYSRTTVSTSSLFLLDFGSTYGAGTATHSLTLYRHSSGALVFGSGTIQWSWGLDATHDMPGTPTDIRMQQATVNLFADMQVQPVSLQAGLVPATASTDTSPPTSTITSPASGASVQNGTITTIQGTAADTGGGVVAGVEISFDGGTTWAHATGTTNWVYNWTPSTSGAVTIRTRAVDDIGNMQQNPASVTVTVSECPCTLWTPVMTPAVDSHNDSSSIEVGVKFTPASSGYITGVRFYKGTQNTGTHVGSLWSSGGQLLARATFSNETASGWQQVSFSSPVAVTAGTTYVVSYHTAGFYSITRPFFTQAYTNGPLTAPSDAASGGNGVYVYNGTSAFPAYTYQATNYWVDVVFTPSTASSNSLWGSSATPDVPSHDDSSAITVGVKFRASTSGTIESIRFYKGPQNTGTHVGSLWTSGGQLLASATFSNETASGWQQVDFSSPVSIVAGTTYVASYHTNVGFYSITRPYFTQAFSNGPLTALADGASGGNGVYVYGSGNLFPSNTYQATNYWVDVVFTPSTAPSNSLWGSSATPDVPSHDDSNAITVGVKFTAASSGTIDSIRFYKGPQNTGTHVGSLWTSGGQLLASATFSNETASGWQQVNFSSPVSITAGTTYVASYHTNVGFYSITRPYFTQAYTNGLLTALADGASGGNGVYVYGSGNLFPSNTYQATNYWVDVVYSAG